MSYLLALLLFPATMAGPVPKNNKDKKPSNLPPLLTNADFDKITSAQLTVVEFYSPYCSHCKRFAPIWKSSYNNFHKDYPDMKIDMRQVNCVESGDLCDQEGIMAYPTIRLYVPTTEGKSKFVGSMPIVQRTEENVIKFLKESVAEYGGEDANVPSTSELLETDTILNLVNGDATVPKFVALFPRKSNDKFPHNCVGCVDAQSIWDRLSNRIAFTVESGHFNCLDHPVVCSQLGFEELTKPNQRVSPRFIMFLPKAARIHQVNYDGPIEINAMKKWAVKLGANSKYEVVTKKTLGSHMKLVNKLEPGKIDHDGKNAVSVVFYFDEVSVTPEDESVLTHLLLELQKSPFNTRLLISKHKQLEEHVNSMSKELIKYINYDTKTPEYKYNKPMEIATTLTAKPTILVFKDNTLMVDIYQTYAPEDIRIFERVEDFIRRSQFPTYHELTPDLLPSYFTKFSDREYKVVIAFVDSKKDITTDLDNLVLAAHEYHHLKKEYYYHKLESDRQRKQKWINELKKQNTESVKVIEAMRKEIPHLWNNDDVLFTYIDKSKANEFNYIPGWKLDIDQYDSGDAIVLSKDYRYYWDHDAKGQKLKNDPATMKHVLLSLLDPRLENSNVVRRVTGSPYSTQFQFMDHIHDYGIFGYLALFSVVYLLGYFFVRRRRRRHRTGNGNTGIIGAAAPKKD